MRVRGDEQARAEGPQEGLAGEADLLTLACVDLPSMPLQWLLRERPEWRAHPVVVVARDEPQGVITHASRRARAAGVRVGMRYAAGLSLCRELRGAVVPREPVERASAELVTAFGRLTPRIERHPSLGTFWLDSHGMLGLFGTREAWCRDLEEVLRELRWWGSIVVGSGAQTTWAIARDRALRGCLETLILSSRADEHARVRAIPLVAIASEVEMPIVEALVLVGITTLGEFLAIPRGELGMRFGARATEWQRALAGETKRPFDPERGAPRFVVTAELDPPDLDTTRIFFCAKGALHGLLGSLAYERFAARSIALRLALERGPRGVQSRLLTESIVPPRATRDAGLLADLLRHKLNALESSGRIDARVETVELEAEADALEGAQLALVGAFAGPDRDALDRGLARLRAALGEDAVRRPILRSSWVPERSFEWERASSPPRGPTSLPLPCAEPPLRLIEPPVELLSSVTGAPRTPSPVVRMVGPHRVQNGWWTAHEVLRDYYLLDCEDGSRLWVFRTPAGGWFLHGLAD